MHELEEVGDQETKLSGEGKSAEVDTGLGT